VEIDNLIKTQDQIKEEALDCKEEEEEDNSNNTHLELLTQHL